MKKTLIILTILALMLGMCACDNGKQTDGPSVSPTLSTDAEWPSEFKGAEVLPKIQSGTVSYYKMYDRLLRIYVNFVKEEDFLAYIELLKTTGYTDITTETSETFIGSMDNYYMVMNRDKDTLKLVIELTSPVTWPLEGYITMIPELTDAVIVDTIGEGNNITLVVEDIGIEAFKTYTASIKAEGFTTMLVDSDTVFVAENEEYTVTVIRQVDKNTMDIGVYLKN
ncbi:MAG: hypothetical protein WCY62_10785 [Clostridia bacterium]